jgi:iron(III) transport system ATP-binding protein
MSVADNVAYGLRVRKLPKSEIAAQVTRALDLVQMRAFAERSAALLSGGQQQRVALARAIAFSPEVLLFDEPLSNLDAKLRAEMRVELRALQHRLGVTSLYVTHDQEEALAISDRVIVMNHRVIEQIGSPEDIYDRPASRFVADFIGDANLVKAEVVEERGERALARLGGVELDLPRRGARPGPVTLAIRPDAVTLHRSAPAGAPALEARIAKASYLGKHVEYTIATPVGDWLVIDRDTAGLIDPGTAVWAAFASAGVTVIPA